MDTLHHEENIETDTKKSVEDSIGIKIEEESYQKLFNLEPRSIICPICNGTHKCKGGKLNSGNNFEFKCDKNEAKVIFWGNKKGEINLAIYFPCKYFSSTFDNGWKLGLENLILDEDRPIIKFYISCEFDYVPPRCRFDYCDQIYWRKYFQPCKMASRQKKYTFDFEFGIEFDREEFDGCIANDEINEKSKKIIDETGPDFNQENAMLPKVNVPQNMSFKKRILYCSPMQNIEYLKQMSVNNKSTIRWIVTIGGIYGAYKILKTQNEKVSIENIQSKCEEYFGMVFEPLKDKEGLKKFLAVATSYSMTYFATKIVLKKFFKHASSENEDEVKKGISEIEKIRKKDSLFPKMEELLPIAISVLVIYLMNVSFDKEKAISLKSKACELFGDFAYKIEAFIDLAKCYIASKFNLDLSIKEDEEKFKKFSNLAIISMILVFLYGTKTSNGGSGMQTFINQLIKITKAIAPSAFGVIVAILVENKIVKEEDFTDIMTEKET